MTVATRNDAALTAPALGVPRAVPRWPVSGYTHRWAPKTLNQPIGAYVNNLPNLIAPAYPFDAGTDSVASRPVLALPTSKIQSVNAAAGKRLRILPLAATIPQPFTLVHVAKLTTAGASVISASVDAAYNLSNIARIGSTASAFEMDAGATLLHTVALDANWHVFISVFNGASSVFSIDGNEVTGNAGTNAFGVNLHIHQLPVVGGGSTYPGQTADIGVYAGALTAAQRATLNGWLRTEYGI